MTYSFRQSFSLYGMQVLLFENQCKSVLGACRGLATSVCTGAPIHTWPCAMWQETAAQLSPCSQEALRSPAISPSAWFPRTEPQGGAPTHALIPTSPAESSLLTRSLRSSSNGEEFNNIVHGGYHIYFFCSFCLRVVRFF